MKMPPEPAALERVLAPVDDRAVQPLLAVAKRPRAQRLLRLAEIVAALVIVALFAFGVVMVATMVSWLYVGLGVLLLAGWPLSIGLLPIRLRVLQLVGIGPVALLVPLLALLGTDVLWSSAGLPRPSPAAGLAIAAVVVTAVAEFYLRWIGREPPPRHWLWAAYSVVAGIALAVLTSQDLPALGLVATAIFVGIALGLYLERKVGNSIRHPLWWALLLSGVALVILPLLAETIEGGRLSLTLLLVAAVITIVAALHGLWRPGDDERRHRLAAWALSIGVVCGIALPLLAFAFVRITSAAPSPAREEPLPAAGAPKPLPRAAVDHRPILLFDSGERFRTPLDVDEMLASGDVELCPEGNGLLAACRSIYGAGDLRNGFGNLRFDTQRVEDDVVATTIYAHAVADKLHPGWTDIDYWWYLPDNPANTAQGAMCGAGLVIPEITCFDHQSDWEGATVVVDERQDPVAVHFAAHDHVVDVPWATLQAAMSGPALRPYAAGRDVADHPLVFVALGTHAAYPLPCLSSTCAGNTVFEDNRHDGRHAWPDAPCSAPGCVTAFPQPANGAGTASWNAFDGHWGSAVCVANVYCARSAAPRAPGRQARYQRPWCYDFAAGADLRHPRPAKPAGCV
jgi:hypothetical protein